MKRNAIALAVALVMLAILGITLAQAEQAAWDVKADNPAEGPRIVFTPLVREMLPTDYVTVTVDIQNGENLRGAGILVHFDPQVVNVVDANQAKAGIQILPGDFFQIYNHYEGANRANNAQGTIEYAVTLLGGAPVSGNGRLATITFQGIGFGSSRITFESVEMFTDQGGSPVPVKPIIGPDASIAVIDPSHQRIYMPALLRNAGP